MIPVPKTLVFELPSPRNGCPLACLHCIHKNVNASTYASLNHNEIVKLLKEGREMGIEFLNIYPHDDEISLTPIHALPYVKLGYELGYKVKTVSSGVNAEGIKELLPYLYRIALSVDATEVSTYGSMRQMQYHKGVLESIEVIKQYKQFKKILVTALVVVNKETLVGIEDEVEKLYQLDVFDKIKILEMLPIGSAKVLKHQALTNQDQLNRLAMLRHKYAKKVDIGTPLWRVRKEQKRGCQLGYKDMVIGPHGELAGCSLLFYLNRLVANIRDYNLLKNAWKEGFDTFRHKENFRVSAVCVECEFYKHDLCWGGCGARSEVFGRGNEIERSCGINNAEESKRLYQRYLNSEKVGSFLQL